MDYNCKITTIPGDHNKVAEVLSRFPRRHTEMPDIPRNLPYKGQVRRITPYRGAGLRINRVLTDMARNKGWDPKYQTCIEATKKESSPKELQEDKPNQQFLKLARKFVTKKQNDCTGLWKDFKL